MDGLAGDDCLVGKDGNDYLDGGLGNDTYKFGIGDGSDSVYDTGGVDKVVFGVVGAIALGRMIDKISPYLVLGTAYAASAAFMTPISSPVNTLVLGPGQYRFGDFVRIGVPFNLLVMVVSVIAIPWFFPF